MGLDTREDSEQMRHCMECGTKLQTKYLEGEGEMPYCSACEQFRFPVFNVAMSVIIKNTKEDRILLIQQYGRERNVLVAGYINKGESAEDAVKREVFEEVGLNAVDIRYNRSEYYNKSNTLMLNFTCSVTSDDYVVNSKEVDKVTWFTIEESKENIASGSLAEKFLRGYLQG